MNNVGDGRAKNLIKLSVNKYNIVSIIYIINWEKYCNFSATNKLIECGVAHNVEHIEFSDI